MDHGRILKYDPMRVQNVALLGFFSRYLTAFKNGKLELVKRDSIGVSQTFTSIPVMEGVHSQADCRMKVNFRHKASGLYLYCRKNGQLGLQKDAKSFEQWAVQKKEKDGTFAFKSHHGKYLCAAKGGTPIADRKKRGDWESWRVIVVQDKDKDKDKQEGGHTKQPMAENDGSYY